MAEWSAIVGARRDSGSGYAWRVARALSTRGFSVGGFIEVPARTPRGEIIGGDIQRVLGEEVHPLLRLSGPGARAEFDARAFEIAAEWVREAAQDFVVIDGMGQLEEAHQGHWQALYDAVAHHDGPHVIGVVRQASLDRVSADLPAPVLELVVPAREREAARYVEALDDRARLRTRTVSPHSGIIVKETLAMPSAKSASGRRR